MKVLRKWYNITIKVYVKWQTDRQNDEWRKNRAYILLNDGSSSTLYVEMKFGSEEQIV
jgi:hypothetical protein